MAVYSREARGLQRANAPEGGASAACAPRSVGKIVSFLLVVAQSDLVSRSGLEAVRLRGLGL